MKDFIQQLFQALSALKTRCNDIVKNLPPIEQYEASSELVWPIRSMTTYCKELAEQATSLESKVAEYETKMTQEVEQRAGVLLQEKLSGGEYVSKADAKTAAETAANSREQNVRQEIATVATRRTELTTPAKAGEKPLIPVELASSLSPELLLAADYRERAGQVATRLQEIAKLGVKMPLGLSQEACSMALDETGNAAFNARLATIKEVAELASGKPSNGTPENPFLTPPPAGGENGSGNLVASI